MLKEVNATRCITPLREGGSLPGLVEADDLGTYVMKVSTAQRPPLKWTAARKVTRTVVLRGGLLANEH
ncbi:hypothetical protein N4G66_12495 [Streptomyces rhizosphaerihabitans]|uniref:hypothetical protein n=1 Tax=Streptomyces rhizosphaerihabitans TaxID=1266770 RepID=UPI0021BDFE4D|nr:hypothetical protein [Streptomyces rhizosphaerihabitans]MCT9005713.1 hypothetical protein [Streptomyces rhizosphaerihabitans]